MASEQPSGSPAEQRITRGAWLALTAALLGWMFDGLEMGLFPLVARPALRDLMVVTDPSQLETLVGRWMGVITAGFLVGAATGGVLFGWLGDRIGRVRAMTLSVFTYATFSGLCGLANSAELMGAFRFIAALGMGGEWALGVALVMEAWPNRSRALMAGLIGAAANVGYLLIGLLGLALTMVIGSLEAFLARSLSDDWVRYLMSNDGWRILMLLGATPALLTFFIRLFVPESESWERERGRGATTHWATRDLLGVVVGALGACGIIMLWAPLGDVRGIGPTLDGLSMHTRVAGTLAGLVVALVGYTYPVVRYMQRSSSAAVAPTTTTSGTLGRMLMGACLGGVALLGTWASVQWASVWADQLTHGTVPEAKAWTQIYSSLGAIIGTILGALMGDWFGRRVTYTLLCGASIVSALAFFQLNSTFDRQFLVMIFLAGATTASFYGWLPLYLPELFPTRVRATGQGFSFNFGRILAAIGVLQTGNLMQVFTPDNTRMMALADSLYLRNTSGYPLACSVMSMIYIVGMLIVWLAPETRGRPLPE